MKITPARSMLLCALLAAGLLACAAQPPSPPGPPLITGKSISPTTQWSRNVGNMPMNLLLSPDGQYVFVSDMGYHQWLCSVGTSDGRQISRIDFSNHRKAAAPAHRPVQPGGEDIDSYTPAGSDKSNGLYYGLAMSRDHRLYAAQGAHDSIAIFNVGPDGALTAAGSIATQRADFPAGLALDDAGRLYVANNASGNGNPFKLSGSVAIYDASAGKELGRYTFTESHGGTSNFPLSIAAMRDGSAAYVAAERDDAVYALDTRDPAHPALAATLPAGAHPVAVLLSPDQKRLYVANSLSDTIAVIDTHDNRIVGTVLLRPSAARDLPGVSPIALALSPGGGTLYAACGDMNAIAVIDASAMQLRGYIPAGWYPSAVAVSPDGQHLWVTTAKGFAVRNPNNKPDLYDPHRKNAYVLSILEGNVCSIPIPTGDDLQEATNQVLADNRLTTLAQRLDDNPLASIDLAAGKITHVIYIIKENRTYDQVLGDLPQGNGDPSLVLFGRDVTPNEHALAERFVLLDNLYASGEVSGDGWNWSTQGMADAYVERNVPYNYSSRGRKFDFEGANNGYPTGGFPAADEHGKPLATTEPFRNGAPPIPDVADTGRNLWDAAAAAHLTLRNYGFFYSTADNNEGVIGGADNYPAAIGLQPGGHDLAGISDLDYRRFDLDFADSDAPAAYARQSGNDHCLFATRQYGDHHAPSRFAEWKREFQMMLAKSPDGAAVPQLMMIRLPNDHTIGARAGKHTPRSCVADNDFALGEIVRTVSHSPIWNSTAIFIIEDDAQSGMDHVDAHRTIGFVVSPWITAHSVDHRFYNTDSFLRTMELLLGLKPLSQYDAVADPVLDWSDHPDNAAPYDAAWPPMSLIAELNPRPSELRAGDWRLELAQRSAAMDFTHADAAPADQLDEIIWKTIKGPGTPVPLPHATLKGKDKVQDKDDD